MRNRLFTLVVAGIVALALVPSAAWGVCQVQLVSSLGTDPAPPTAAQAASQIAFTAAPAGGASLNLEGRTERVSDVLIFDDGSAAATNCFQVNNSIRLTYNGTLTSPTSIASATTANFDVFDNAGSAGLVILASSTVGLAPGGLPQTVITITVQQGGTLGNLTTGATGSAVRVKNLRIDANGLALATAPHTPATVTVTAATAGTLPTAFTGQVGTANTTVTGGSIAHAGSGTQSAGGGLTTSAEFTFGEGFLHSLRVAGGTCNSTTVSSDTCVSGVANDIATNATSLIFDVGTTLPSSVSVTWPGTISTSASAAAGTGLILTLRNAPSCSGPGSPCFAIYDTTKGDATAAATLTVDTAAAAAGVAAAACGGTGQPACSAYTGGPVPFVGVNIGSPSGAGTVKLHGFFGPGEAGSGDDDVQAAAVPRYISTNTTATLPSTTRQIFANGTWFTINPTRTTLLFPYVTEVSGYETGIVVANTGLDTGVFGATSTGNQTGGITFYFFPTAGTPFTLNTDTTAGGTVVTGARGLNSVGQVAAGGAFVCSLANLLKAANYTGATFDGYVIAVTGFNNAHGSEIIFNTVGNHSFAPANVLGKSGRNDGNAESLNN